jgi:hypothetical protein
VPARALVVAGVVLAIVLGSIRTIAVGQLGTNATATPPPFTEKILVVSCKSGPEMGAVLESGELKKVGDITFLVGRGVDDGHSDNWYKGKTVWIALDDISMMVEFKDAEAVRKSYSDRKL